MEPRNCSGSHRGECDRVPTCVCVHRAHHNSDNYFILPSRRFPNTARVFIPCLSRGSREYPRKRARLSFLARSSARLISLILISLFRSARRTLRLAMEQYAADLRRCSLIRPILVSPFPAPLSCTQLPVGGSSRGNSEGRVACGDHREAAKSACESVEMKKSSHEARKFVELSAGRINGPVKGAVLSENYGPPDFTQQFRYCTAAHGGFLAR
jgi:hypothetical protein